MAKFKIFLPPLAFEPFFNYNKMNTGVSPVLVVINCTLFNMVNYGRALIMSQVYRRLFIVTFLSGFFFACQPAVFGQQNGSAPQPPKKISVLFLCTGNSCRSQMAEGWTRALKSDTIDAYSAGVETHGLNPNAVKVMAEAGVDITGQRSKNISEFKDVHIDYVVAVCDHAAKTCPIFPQDCKVVRKLFNDPPKMAKEAAQRGESPEKQLDCYREVRDQIRDFVKTLPGSLEK